MNLIGRVALTSSQWLGGSGRRVSYKVYMAKIQQPTYPQYCGQQPGLVLPNIGFSLTLLHHQKGTHESDLNGPSLFVDPRVSLINMRFPNWKLKIEIELWQ